jgi:drug/metabolite transporter (DMT)-like permease
MSTETADTPPTPPPALHLNFRRGTVFMLLSLACFTTNSLLLNHFSAQRHIDPWVSMTFRFAIGLVMTFGLFAPSGSLKIGRCFTGWLMASRGILGALGTAAYYWTIPSLGAGKATLICNTYVVFASVFAMCSLGEKLTLKRLLWLLAAFAGIALLVGPGDGGGGFTFGFYEVLALFGAVMAAWAVVLVRQLSLGFSIGTIYLAQCLWILGPVAILAVPDLASLSWNETGLLALAATAASFGQLAMNEGYRCLTVTTGASVQMLWPVATTVGGWMLFGERFGALQWLGASLILAAIFKITAGSVAVRRN